MKIAEILGTKLKGLRKERNLTQQKVALDIGLAQQSYSHYENGERLPELDTFLRLSNYYDVSMNYLLGIPEKSEAHPEYDAYLMFIANSSGEEKYRYLTRPSKELLYYFENLSNEDREDLLELARLKYRRFCSHYNSQDIAAM